jgi:LmbE family N-acetylglucosaminyl deacetylase
MLGLSFGPERGPLRILCLGAHSDDIEIGCGAAILRLLAERPGTHVRWVVFSALGDRAAEARDSASRFLRQAASSQVQLEDFQDGFFPHVGGRLKQRFEAMKSEFEPDVVLTHFRQDLHQDHRVVSDLTWNTYRNHFILEYEVPKYDGDLGAPNCFVPVTEAVLREKIANLMACFASQRGKGWFTEDTFAAIARLRGVECNAPDRYAEAFYCRKAVL